MEPQNKQTSSRYKASVNYHAAAIMLIHQLFSFSFTSVSARWYIVSCLPSRIATYRAATNRKSLNLQQKQRHLTSFYATSVAVAQDTLVYNRESFNTGLYLLYMHSTAISELLVTGNFAVECTPVFVPPYVFSKS